MSHFPESHAGDAEFLQESARAPVDRVAALKRGEAVAAPKCQTPIVAHHALGERLGIHGTPGIITSQGEYLAGYLPAASMAEYLKQSASAAAAARN